MRERFEVVPVGYVRSAVSEPECAPRQGRDAGLEVTVEVLPVYREALEGLSGRPRVVLVCWMHRARRDLLRIVPRGDPDLPPTGVFATRTPNRPNPLSLYTCELLGIEGITLRLRGVDAVDGTPVLDIRPFVERLDG